VHCGLCAESCHYYLATGDPKLTPAYKADQVRHIYKKKVDWLGKVAPGWVGGDVPRSDADLEQLKDIVFGDCTMCRRCTLNCPFGIDKALIMRSMRGHLTRAGVAPEGILVTVKDQWETGNQMGVSQVDYLETLEWIEEEVAAELDDPTVKIPIDKHGAEMVFVVNPREIKYAPLSLMAAVKIFHVAGADWTMPSVGWDNTNFGLFSGLDDLGGHMGKLAFDQAIKLGVKKMVISECGHGYRSTKWESPNWAKMDLPFVMESFLETMIDYVESGRIVLDPSKNPDPVTYHDPCNLSRSSGITEEPRWLLKRACREFREMYPNRADSFCCSGGGGAMSMSEYAPRRLEVAKIKADQIQETGAKAVATACHNCEDGLTDLIKHYKLGVPVKNVCEFVADAIVIEKKIERKEPVVPTELTGKTILVVDDEPHVVAFLTTLLSDHGYQTLAAGDGNEGMALAREHKPDLITLDISMPEKSGVAVYNEMRADPELATIPILVVTAVVDMRKLLWSRKTDPPEGFIEKPIDNDVLLGQVRRILGAEAKKVH
jgi:Fe-S oxidoreductase/CheY-like chemotaxis protein